MVLVSIVSMTNVWRCGGEAVGGAATYTPYLVPKSVPVADVMISGGHRRMMQSNCPGILRQTTRQYFSPNPEQSLPAFVHGIPRCVQPQIF